MEQLSTEAALPAKRPVFLTVLCILSFVGIAISLVSNIIAYLANSAAAHFGDVANSIGAASGVKGADAIGTLANAAVNVDFGKAALVNLIQALLNLPILAGVILMLKQKKLGFYIYTPFEVIQAILPVVFGLGLGGFSTISGLILTIAFIVMYGLNLKHMQANAKGDEKSEKTAVAASGQKQTSPTATASIEASTFYEVRVSNVTCIPVGTTFKVGLTVTAKKFCIDSKTGKVKEEMINDEIQIGMLKDTKEVYLKSYKFTKTITSLNLTLDQKPDKIGIDPYNKLPEKA